MKTLLYYATHKHKGFVLTPEQVKKHYANIKDVSTELKAKMQRRPVDQLRPMAMAGPGMSRTEERSLRFPRSWGATIAADSTGGFSPKAYGGITTVYLFLDLARASGYFYAVYYTDGIKNAAAKATSSMGTHWDRFGNFNQDWSATLRADSGSFTSAATEEVCEGFRWNQLFSVPNTQAQNPIEAHIKQLFIKVTMFYARAPWVPRFLWVFAIQYAILCLNLAIHPDETEPSWESFRKEQYDWWSHPMMGWGDYVEVFIPLDDREWKFGARSFTGLFMGTAVGFKQAILVFNLSTGKMRVTRDYRILPSSEIPQGPLYVGNAKAGANVFVPTAPKDGETVVDLPDTHLVGGDPTVMPIMDSPEPSFLEEVTEDSVPTTALESEAAVLQEVHTPTVAPLVTPSLLPAADENPNAYDMKDVEPTALVMEYVALSSMDEDGNLLPGASMAYTLSSRDPVNDKLEEVYAEDVDDDCDSDCDEETKPATKPKASGREVRLLSLEDGRFAVIKRDDKVQPEVSSKFSSDEKSAKDKLQQRIHTMQAIRVNSARGTDRGAPNSKRARKIRKDDNPTLHAALSGPYKQLVREAVVAELTQYTETYEALEIFDDAKVATLTVDELANAITSHFEITYKRDKDTHALERVKARLCIHGNETSKYDFDDVKSPTARTASMKLVMAILAKRTADGRAFHARTWDVTGAFLQTKISERTWAKRNKDPLFEEPSPMLLRLPDGRIGSLSSYVYGLKQASLEFRNSVDELLRASGYMSTADPCIYVKDVGKDKIIITCHVDDFLAVSTSKALLDEFGAVLSNKFGQDITVHSGDKLQYMGMVIQVCKNGDVFVSQPAYYMKLWKEYADDFDLVEASFLKTNAPRYPMHANQDPLPRDDEAIDSTWYKGVIGALNHLALMTRPDISFSLSVLASKCNSPTRGDVRRVKHLFRFVMGTRHLGLNFKRDSDFQLHVWADASYASREETRSQTGYCFSLGADNATIYAKSTKQHLVTLSSTESEYVAMFHSCTEVVFLKRLLQQLGFDQDPITIYQDNQSTIHWAEGKENFHRVKHLDVKYHYVRELLKQHVIAIEYLVTTEMIADVLTKALVNDQFQYLAAGLLGIYSFDERIKTERFQVVSLSS